MALFMSDLKGLPFTKSAHQFKNGKPEIVDLDIPPHAILWLYQNHLLTYAWREDRDNIVDTEPVKTLNPFELALLKAFLGKRKFDRLCEEPDRHTKKQTPFVYVQDRLTKTQLYLCLVDQSEPFRIYIDQDAKAISERKAAREVNRKRWKVAEQALHTACENIEKRGTANKKAAAAGEKAEAAIAALRKEFAENSVLCPHTDVDNGFFPSVNSHCNICGTDSYNNPAWN